MRVNQAKIVFDLGDHGLVSAETMFADVLGNGLYRLTNVPIFAPCISVDDIFSAKFGTSGRKQLHFEKVVERSKNVTHRIWLADADDLRERVRLVRNKTIAEIRSLTERAASYAGVVFTFSVSATISNAEKAQLSEKFTYGERNGWWKWNVSSSPRFPETSTVDW